MQSKRLEILLSVEQTQKLQHLANTLGFNGNKSAFIRDHIERLYETSTSFREAA
jgi:predicted DNA-binding protein